MDQNAKVTVYVLRWAEEEINVIDLLVSRVVDYRVFGRGKLDEKDTEYDFYSNHNEPSLYRCGTLVGLTSDDFELWENDRRAFWVKNINQVDDDMIRGVSLITDHNWRVG